MTRLLEITDLHVGLPAGGQREFAVESANLHLDATEHGDQLIFMHKVKDGPANQSYGLQVAKLAGVPPKVIRRAGKYLAELEQQALRQTGVSPQQELSFAAPASASCRPG